MADRYCIQVHLGNICEKQKERASVRSTNAKIENYLESNTNIVVDRYIYCSIIALLEGECEYVQQNSGV